MTSVPFDHVSPAVMYAQNVDRDDYQDLAREMLGLPGIIQQARQGLPSTRASTSSWATGFGDHEPGGDHGAAGEERGARATSTSPTPTSRRSTSRTAASTSSSTPSRLVNGGRGIRHAAATEAAQAIRAPLRLLRPRGARPPPVPHRRRPIRPRAQHRPRRQAGTAEVYTPADRLEQPDARPDDRGRPDRPGRAGPISRSPCSSRPATSISPCTPTTSITPSAPSTAARTPSAPSSAGSRRTATGTTRS